MDFKTARAHLFGIDDPDTLKAIMQVSQKEFLSNPDKVYEMSQRGVVTVLGDDGEACARLYTPRNPLPMLWD